MNSNQTPRRVGVSLRRAYRPANLRELDALAQRHPCAACGEVKEYTAGDKGPRRTLGEIIYYRAALKCPCGFMNFMQVIVNDLPEERSQGTQTAVEAIQRAELQGLLRDSEVEELLVDTSAAAFQADWKKAMELAQRCVDRDETHPAAWYNFGVVLLAQGYPDRSLPAFQRVTKLSEEFASAWFKMGEIHEGRNEMAQAIECFDRFLNRYPDDAEAIRRRDKCNSQLE